MPAYILDMDGTLYRGNDLLDGSKELFIYLSSYKFLVMTNCPIYSSFQLSEKLLEMGISIPKEKIITSAQVAAEYLNSHGIKEAYVIGSPALKREIENVGILLTQENPQIVLVGQDNELRPNQLKKAAELIKNGAEFYCTNKDLDIPYGDTLHAHTGRIVLELMTRTGISAKNFGKPDRHFLQLACNKLLCDISDIRIIGDNLDTDIRMGQINGVTTYLLLTGITQINDLESSAVKPSKVFKTLRELINYEFL